MEDPAWLQQVMEQNTALMQTVVAALGNGGKKELL